MLSLLQREPYRSQFIATMSSILHNSSTYTITSSALQLLGSEVVSPSRPGRFGGRSRSMLRGRLSLPCTMTPSSGFAVDVDGTPWVLDDLLETAVRLLDRNLIVESLEGTETKLSVTLHTHPDNITLTRGVRIAYKRIAIHLFQLCFTACCHHQTTPRDPTLVYRLESVLSGTAHFAPLESASVLLKSQSRVVMLILYGLLLACCDVEVKEEAMRSVHEITTYVAALVVNYSTYQKDSQYEEYFMNSQFLRERAKERMGVIVDSLPITYTAPANSLDLIVFFEALLTLLCRDYPSVTDVVCEVVKNLWSVIQEQSSKKSIAMILAVPCMELFFFLSEREVHHHDWRVHVCHSLWVEW